MRGAIVLGDGLGELERAGLVSVGEAVTITPKGRRWFQRLTMIDRDAVSDEDDLIMTISALVR